ncbi:hypothetical protein EM595_p1037 (plasmid) [Duffyella gerundensis]|uniref:Uncharacterized protein n=1 Tax=Duffyella gerundensis TaxID=1619313 RepID=A0A0U5LUZ2_9GAMM|nr:hypothetical protein EM595_p1037 [Duffyella gerundensis]
MFLKTPAAQEAVKGCQISVRDGVDKMEFIFESPGRIALSGAV